MAHRHKAQKKKASGGSITEKPGMEESGGTPSVLKEAKEKKKGGRVSHMAGGKAKHRLDKPGRKHGGRAGADRSPLSTANRMAGGAKTDTGGPLEAPK